MIEFAKLPILEREPYFAETATRRNLTQLIVEKDFWVCVALRFLFSTPALAGKLVFKGGTSLSKVFGVIERFSEDIDLSVDPGWLGFEEANSSGAVPSKSLVRKKIQKLNEKCARKVDQVVRPALETAVQDALGPSHDGREYFAFSLEPQAKSPVLTFRYPTKEQASAYVRPEVKLELGSLADQVPKEIRAVGSWVANEFPNQFEEPKCSVVALEAERTFWEKATILHAEYHRDPAKPMRPRLSRDYYDLYRLARHDVGARAMNDMSLLERVVKHKRMYFPSKWANYEQAKPGSLRLAPPEHRRDELRTDYRQMSEMFFGEQPPFDEIERKLRSLETKINGNIRSR